MRRADGPDETAGQLLDFCWTDIKTRDVGATTRFFQAVLGWTWADDPDDWRSATTAFADGRRIAGISDLRGDMYPLGLPDHVA